MCIKNSKIKVMFSLVLVFVIMLQSSFSLVSFAENNFLLYSEDFETVETINWQTSAEAFVDNSTISSVQSSNNEFYYLGNKLANLVTNAQAGYIVYQTFTPTENIRSGKNSTKGYTVDISFDMIPAADGTTVCLLGQTNSGTIDIANNVIGLNITGSKLSLYQRNRRVVTSEIELSAMLDEYSLLPNMPKRVKIVFNVTDDSAAYIGKYDVYIDGVLVADDIAYEDAQKQAKICGFAIDGNAESEAAVNMAQIDNIRVCDYNSETEATYNVQYPDKDYAVSVVRKAGYILNNNLNVNESISLVSDIEKAKTIISAASSSQSQINEAAEYLYNQMLLSLEREEKPVTGQLFYEDFEQSISGTKEYAIDYGYDEYDNFNKYNIGKALNLNSKKYIKFNDSQISIYPESSVEKYGSNYFCITNFDIYLESINAFNAAEYDIYFTSDYAPNRWLLDLNIIGGSVSAIVNENSDGTRKIENTVELETDNWHSVQVVMQFTDENAKSKVIIDSVSIDGEILISDVERTLSSYQQKIRYYNMLAVVNRKEAPYGYIDNISVCGYSNPTDTVLNSDLGILEYRIRHVENTLREYRFLENKSIYTKLENLYDDAVELIEFSPTESECIILAHQLADAEEAIYAGKEPITFENVVYSDGEQVMPVMPSEGKICSVVACNNTNSSIEADIYFAFYSDDRLVDVHCIDTVTFASGRNTIDFEDFAYGGDFDSFNIYVWKDKVSLTPIIESVDPSYTTLNNIRVYYNDEFYYTDVPTIRKIDGKIYLCAENLFNLFGATLTKTEDGYKASRIGEQSIEFSLFANTATQGENVLNIDKPYLNNGVLMFELESLLNLYGGEYTINQDILNITYNYQEPGDNVGYLGFLYRPECTFVGYTSAVFKMKFSDSSSDIRFYTRLSSGDRPTLNSSIDENGEITTNYKWSLPLESVYLWKPASSLIREGNYVYGSFNSLWVNGKSYDLLIEIDDGSETKRIIKNNFFTLKSSSDNVEDYAYSAETLTLNATFENISYYINSDKGTSASVYYKEATSSEWLNGYEPTYDERISQYLGSITKLNHNTNYDVKVVVDGREYVGSVTTMNENPQYETLMISDVYSSGKLVLHGMKGENSYIRILGDGSTVINADENDWEAVLISDCSNIILENLTIVGGLKNGVSISGGSNNIRIVNCDISNWGRNGTWDEQTKLYRKNFSSVNYDAGISIFDSENIVVERCYIHDSAAKTNTWNGKDWNYVHPAGSCAIYCNSGKNFVIRYNDFIGSDNSRFNDGIEGALNHEYEGGIGYDADVYGNMFYGGNDDAIELDGGSMNVRMYDNRIEQFYCGISLAPIRIGPVYVFDNLIYNLGDETGIASHGIKQGTESESVGKQFMFGNTILSKKVNRGFATMTAINNIISSDPSVHPISYAVNLRNNILCGKTNGYDLNSTSSVAATDMFENVLSGKVWLKEGDVDFGVAEYINNFNDSTDADIGAVQDKEYYEFRPIQIGASDYNVKLVGNESKTITIKTGDVDEGLQFSIKCSAYYPGYTIIGDTEGVLSDNSEYQITVIGDMENVDEEIYNSAILFRLENGYSIPISVTCQR